MCELTPREREVALLMVRKGYDCRQAGEALGLKRRTVETHLYNIFPKLGIANLRELDRHALINGWVKVDELETHHPPGHRGYLRQRADSHGNDGSVPAVASAA